MRVLYAYNQHRGRGGAENFIQGVIETSRAAGLEVETFTRSSEDLPKNLLGRVQAAAGAVYAAGAVRDFRALLGSFQPDIVHVYELFPLVSPWILPECTKRGIPVVKTCVDYRLTCPTVTHLRDGRICTLCTEKGPFQALRHNCRNSLPESLTVAFYGAMTGRLRLFKDHVSHYIAPSEFSRRWLQEKAEIAPDRISAITPFVEIPKTAADPAQGSYVAYAGRFTPEKGIETFIQAAKRCGLPFRACRHESSQVSVGLPPEVEEVVTRGKRDLDEFYRGARFLVFPSVWFETFGLVGAEAMSHGIPIVVSRLGALGELVEDGRDGLHFEPGDAADLAEKTLRLWNDPELCRRLGAAARLKAQREWTAERRLRRLLQVYERVRGGERMPRGTTR